MRGPVGSRRAAAATNGPEANFSVGEPTSGASFRAGGLAEIVYGAPLSPRDRVCAVVVALIWSSGLVLMARIKTGKGGKERCGR